MLSCLAETFFEIHSRMRFALSAAFQIRTSSMLPVNGLIVVTNEPIKLGVPKGMADMVSV